MPIVENLTWHLGPFTIHQRARLDSPAWAVFLIYRGSLLIGKNFSRPSESDCEYIASWRGVYASDTKSRDKSAGRRGR